MTAAHLRMPGRATPDEKEQLVDSLIRRLGLANCAGSLVGDSKKRGLSGGEKKRLSIAAELIAGPKLLFTGQLRTSVLQGGMAAWCCCCRSAWRVPGCWAGCGRDKLRRVTGQLRGFAAGPKSSCTGRPHARGSLLSSQTAVHGTIRWAVWLGSLSGHSC